MIRSLLISLTAFCLVTSGTEAQFTFGNYALTNLNIVDVNTKEILENRTIVIRNQRISGIYNSDQFSPEDSLQIINLKGKYVHPGLIDAHVHMATDASQEIRANAEKVLEEMLRTGITAVRDMAGDARALSSLSRDALVGDIDAPNVYYSSLMAGPKFFTDPRTIATAQGGKSGEMSYMKAIDESTNLVNAVAQAKGTGAHGIKLYAMLPKELVGNINKEAANQNMPVWSHGALIPSKPSEVIPSGVISISHANMLVNEFYENKDIPENWKENDNSEKFWDQEYQKLDIGSLLELMKKHNVVMDATLSVFEQYKEYESYRWRYEMAIRITKDAYARGVKVAAGSDTDQETFVQYEMGLLINESGFTPFDAIIAATKHAAQATGILENEGTIEVGKKANLVVLNMNPTEDINNLEGVEMVIKDGKLYNPK